MAANHYPDGLTIEAITALQREVNDELRREGYPVQPAQSQSAFMAGRPAPARRHRDNHSSPRPDGQPTRSLPTGDGHARNPRWSSGQRERTAGDLASSSGSG